MRRVYYRCNDQDPHVELLPTSRKSVASRYLIVKRARGRGPATQPSTYSEVSRMTRKAALREGDRVRATHRTAFPYGTVVRVLEGGFVLVRWDGDVLETAHLRELTKLDPNSARR